jgi:predicted ribosome quality control (RQC) complex YloA/Tae2 family protein
MTSFDVAAVVHELEPIIKSARIENIYQLNSFTLLFRLHQPNQQTLQLLLEAGKRVHLTSYVLSKPLTPPAFCMALRKHLRNGRIIEIIQHEFERVVIIKVDTREGTFSLIAELFGDGNIILVNPQGAILYALTYKRMRDRNVLRGERFQHAPSSGKNPLLTRREDFDKITQFGPLEIVRALTKLLSIGGFYSEEILLRANVDKNTHCEALTNQQIDALFAETQTLLSKIPTGKIEPSVVVDEKGEWVDAVPFSLKKYDGLTLKPSKSFNEALDEYYSKTSTIDKVSIAEKEFAYELTKLQRMLRNQEETLEESMKAVEESKAIGNLIYAHFSELESLTQKILDEKGSGKSWEQIVSDIEKEKQKQRAPFTYVQSLDYKRRLLQASIENTTFTLDLTRSIQANAAEYYERAKKVERKLEGTRKALLETKTRIEALQLNLKQKTAQVLGEVKPKKREKSWYEKFRWFRSSEGFLVLGGRDATTNEILIKKHTDPSDIVFHAEIAGAPFVVIKTEGKTSSEQTILEAAQFAASYSKVWKEMFHTVDVYWVHPNQLSKSPPPRQYLEKGAFIILGKKNYVRAVPTRVAVGIVRDDNHVSVAGGPVEAVARQTTVYVEIVPGEHASSELAKKIRKLLIEKAFSRWQRQVVEISLEEVQSFIPYGKGNVVLQP